MQKWWFLIAIVFLMKSGFAQKSQLNFSAYDGFVVVGYVDAGGFINFTGPNINYRHNESKFVFGMLPSLCFKEDRGQTKNSFVTPNLGIGFTYSYKIWAIQIPLYYNPKTITDNGRWYMGVGLGLRLDKFNSRNFTPASRGL